MRFIDNFPEGTRINMAFTDGLSFWQYDTAPSSLPWAVQYYRSGDDIPTRSNLFMRLDKIDLSEVENMYVAGEPIIVNGDVEDMTLNFDNAKYLYINFGIMSKYIQTSSTSSDRIYLNKLTLNFPTIESLQYLPITQVKELVVNTYDAKPTVLSNILYNADSVLVKVTFNMDFSNVTTISNFFPPSNLSGLTELNGFPNLKRSMNDNYSLYRAPNLSYESCISIMRNLYDFTGNGETPTSSQGKLKVHANFLTTVGDEISIATSRGWVITT